MKRGDFGYETKFKFEQLMGSIDFTKNGWQIHLSSVTRAADKSSTASKVDNLAVLTIVLALYAI